MGKVKVKKLREALEYVTAHPEEWNQGVWAKRTACGTACCLAGRIVLQAGHELDYFPEERYDYDRGEFVRTGHWIADDIVPDKKYPEGAAIEKVAERALNYSPQKYIEMGEDYWDMADLFEGYNSLRDLWEIANKLTDGKIEVPSYLPGDNDGAE